MNKSGEEQLVHGVGVAVLVHHLRWGEQTRWPKGVDVVHLSSGKFNNTISVAMTMTFLVYIGYHGYMQDLRCSLMRYRFTS